MSLRVSLRQAQLDAAGRLHAVLKDWSLSDSALLSLRTRIPGFSPEACVLKTVAVNSLYGTQVFATVRMAKHVCHLLEHADLELAGTELVEAIARLPPAKEDEKQRVFVSFAAKFCHFFVDEERFPIYDEAARNVLMLHLGPEPRQGKDRGPYEVFCERFNRLRSEAGLSGSARDLDRYLWLTGMWMRWVKQKDSGNALVNMELQGLFRDPPPTAVDDLDAMLPDILKRQQRPAK